MNDGATAHRTSYGEAISVFAVFSEGSQLLQPKIYPQLESGLLNKPLTCLTSHHFDRESNPAA